MAWWVPQLACFVGGVVYGVVCTLMVHGSRELARLRQQKARKLRHFPVDPVALGRWLQYKQHRPEQGGPAEHDNVGRPLPSKLWSSGEAPPSHRP